METGGSRRLVTKAAQTSSTAGGRGLHSDDCSGRNSPTARRRSAMQGNDKEDHTDEITDSCDLGGPILKETVVLRQLAGTTSVRRPNQSEDVTLLKSVTEGQLAAGRTTCVVVHLGARRRRPTGSAGAPAPRRHAFGPARSSRDPPGSARSSGPHFSRTQLNGKGAYYSTGRGWRRAGPRGVDLRQRRRRSRAAPRDTRLLGAAIHAKPRLVLYAGLGGNPRCAGGGGGRGDDVQQLSPGRSYQTDYTDLEPRPLTSTRHKVRNEYYNAFWDDTFTGR